MITRPIPITSTMHVGAALLVRIAHSEAGNPAAIEVKISSDIPLPTPRSVTSSPSHMIRPVPAVIVITMMHDGHQAVVRDQLSRCSR